MRRRQARHRSPEPDRRTLRHPQHPDANGIPSREARAAKKRRNGSGKPAQVGKTGHRLNNVRQPPTEKNISMPLNKRTAENYTPLYLLASLGAGSMAVAVYLHRRRLRGHGETAVTQRKKPVFFKSEVRRWDVKRNKRERRFSRSCCKQTTTKGDETIVRQWYQGKPKFSHDAYEQDGALH
jgi:hypothetical protein